MQNDPFAAPGEAMEFLTEPDPYRSRPEITASYDGECFCGLEFSEGDAIRATADGAGWEAVEHGHDPEESAPVDPAPLTGDSETVPHVAPEEAQQFSCPCCPAAYAPTKNKRVRKHNASGTLCPGSGQTPVELRETPQTTEKVADLMDLPATLLSPASQGALDRIAAGPQEPPNPHRAPLPTSNALTDGVEGQDYDPQSLAAWEASESWKKERDAWFAAGPDVKVSRTPEEFALNMALDGEAYVEISEPESFTVGPVQDPSIWEHRDPEPEPERDGYGRYILPHPVTGKSQSWRRVTTFASVLDDTYNLDAWQKRHLVRGAAQNPDRLAGVAKLEITRDDPHDKQILNDLANELMEASGSKTAAEQGTYVHELTEAVDRATTPEARNAALAAVPDHYRADVTAYTRQLDRMGLRVVPALLERRTVVAEYGVAGTFDQVCMATRDLPDAGLLKGDFVVTDKKTGSDVSYATLTHAIQLWLYADGINTSGIWDELEREWTHPVRVRDDVGIIVHIPLELGECTLHVLKLEEGRKAAKLVQAVYDTRALAKSKRVKMSRRLGTTLVVPKETPVSVPVAAPAPDVIPPEPTGVGWQARVAAVSNNEQAFAVYQDAETAGMPKPMLEQLTDAMKRAVAAAPSFPDNSNWESKAGAVTSKAEASGVYTDAAADPDMTADRLAQLVRIMQDALVSDPPF